jgi:caspase domain-containing protein
MAKFKIRGVNPGLCLPERPTASLLDNVELLIKSSEMVLSVEDFEETSEADCRFWKKLPGDMEQYELSSRLSETVNPFSAAWDNTRTTLDNATIHVQTVGVSRYPYGSGLAPLPYAVNDAEAIETYFNDLKQIGVNVHIWERLEDDRASLPSIRKRLAEISSQSAENDIVILFFSGHGVVPPGQEMFYFLPGDIAGKGSEDVRVGGLNTAMLAEAVRNASARRLLLIMDACQSGGALGSLKKVADAKYRIEQFRDQVEPDSGRIRFGIYLIAAATPLEKAIEPRVLQHGVLTGAILRALHDNPTSVLALSQSLGVRVHELSTALRSKQSPVIFSEGTDFPLGVAAVDPKQSAGYAPVSHCIESIQSVLK